MHSTAEGKLTPVNNLTEFFRDALDDALAHQHVSLDAQSAHYVVNLLTLFSRTENSHAELKPGQRWVCLADLLARPRAPRHARSAKPRCSGSGTYRCSSPDSSPTASPGGWSTSTTTSRWVVAPTARWQAR